MMSNALYASTPPQPSASDFAHSTPVRTDPALNLSVLQRYLPSTVKIDMLAPFAVIYIFSTTTHAWEKSGIEGTLFIVTLQTGRHAVIVLNRRSLDNFILHIESADTVDVTDDYICMQGNNVAENSLQNGGGKAGEQKVYGLWIFEEEHGSTKGTREACGNFVRGIVAEAGKERGIGSVVVDGQANGHTQQQPDPSGVDLMALLNRNSGRGSI